MKAILVIDMPKCCDECPVMDFDQYKCSIVDDVVDEKWDVGRQPWCPLKPMPSEACEMLVKCLDAMEKMKSVEVKVVRRTE